MSMAIEMNGGAGARRGRCDGARRCAVTGRTLDKSRLVRFVRAPDGSVVADLKCVLPGRGIWVDADREMIERACAKNGALVRAGHVAPGFADRIEQQLLARCESLIGLARRAGELALGQDAVRAMLRDGEAGVLVVARDAASDSRDKVAKLHAAVAPDVGMVEALDRDELGRAVGRASAVFLAVRAGRLAARLSAESARLAGFRSVSPVGNAGRLIGGHEMTKEAERQ